MTNITADALELDSDRSNGSGISKLTARTFFIFYFFYFALFKRAFFGFLFHSTGVYAKKALSGHTEVDRFLNFKNYEMN